MNRRTNHRAKVDLLVNRFLDGHPYMCRMTDISATGVRLVPLLEPKGAPRYIGLQFQLPGEDAVLVASGEVINETGADGRPSSGVRFTSLAPECASVIQRFVAAN